MGKKKREEKERKNLGIKKDPKVQEDPKGTQTEIYTDFQEEEYKKK